MNNFTVIEGGGSRRYVGPPSGPSDGSGDGGNVEARIARLETKMDKVDERLGKLEIGVAVLTERVGHLPSKGFIVTATMSAIAFVVAVILLADKIKTLIGI